MPNENGIGFRGLNVEEETETVVKLKSDCKTPKLNSRSKAAGPLQSLPYSEIKNID